MTDLGDTAKKASDALKEGASKAATNASQLNARVIDHAEENTRAAFAALRSAAGVTSIGDLTKIQSDFVQEQSNRSMNQVREVGEMIAAFGRDMGGMLGGKKE